MSVLSSTQMRTLRYSPPCNMSGHVDIACASHLQLVQVLYLLDIPSRELKHITTTYDVMTMTHVQWCPDGSLILVPWDDYLDNKWKGDVHERCGERIATFKPDCAFSYTPPSMAFLQDARLAIPVSSSSFEVWDLLSGQSVGRRTPAGVQRGSGDPQLWDKAGTVAGNHRGTQLAFLPAGCLDVHLYSCALEPVGKLHLGGDAPPSDRKVSSLVHGTYGLMLSSRLQRYGGPKHQQGLQVFRQLPGSSQCKEVLRAEDQLDQEPTCSPDGAYLLLVDTSHGNSLGLRVHDARSGQVLFGHVVSLPADDQHPKSFQKRSAVSWSSCGSRLLVRIDVAAAGQNMDHVTVLQL